MTTSQGDKVIVAVHGIGDQVRNVTIQTVALQFCRCLGVSGAIPLGRLHTSLSGDDSGAIGGYFRFVTPPDPDMRGYGLAEVYWADIPRQAAKDGYMLEETKAWAKTIVERLRCRQERRLKEKPDKQSLQLPPEDYELIKEVLSELLEGVAVIEHLVSWLEKTTKFRFPLKKILVDYLDDVQVVADYGSCRRKILDQFHKVMNGICRQQQSSSQSPPEIYLVAHSEGTVVSFLALLEALKADNKEKYIWGKHVKGFMTIGSPIDKHFILWNELFDEFRATGDAAQWLDLEQPITWYNYYDYGDPIGFNLDTIRHWVNGPGGPPFDFTDKNDIGFSRYPLPGKAHNDYWNDREVFQHFIDTVVRKEKTPAPKPATRKWVPFPSALLPYLLSTLLCILGSWLIYKTTAGALHVESGKLEMARNVVALGATLAFSTAAARIPRLTKAWWLRGVAVLLLIIALVVAHAPTDGFKQFLMTGPTVAETEPDERFLALARHFQTLCPSTSQPPPAPTSGGEVQGVAASEEAQPVACKLEWDFPLQPVPALALVIVLAGWSFGRVWRKGGMFPMLAVGVLGISLLVFGRIGSCTTLPLWPMVMALIGFLYLWWLAAIIFDLAFVWHRYICFNVGIERMEEICTGDSCPRHRLREKPESDDKSKVKT